jgi:inorganic pyrophosphatase/exopolyphosphatase
MAIISNTINLTNSLTTKRDIKMANFLKDLFCIDENIVNKIFELKSSLDLSNIKDSFLSDIKSIKFND